MADLSRQPRSFSRGSAVLEYWLVHAEGLVVLPIGSRVERVVMSAPPAGRAEALIVRSRLMHRRRAIPAAAIAAVEPFSGRLILDAQEQARSRLLSPERTAAARARLDDGQRLARVGAGSAVSWTRAATVATILWVRPRATQTGTTIARHTRVAAAHTRSVVRWLAPRVGAAARTAATTAGRLALEVAAFLAHTARRGERATVSGAGRARASVEARYAQRSGGSRSRR
jgi:hypothetical protein